MARVLVNSHSGTWNAFRLVPSSRVMMFVAILMMLMINTGISIQMKPVVDIDKNEVVENVMLPSKAPETTDSVVPLTERKQVGPIVTIMANNAPILFQAFENETPLSAVTRVCRELSLTDADCDRVANAYIESLQNANYSLYLPMKESPSIARAELPKLPEGFEGEAYRLPDMWTTLLPFEEMKSKPINYLEIGVYYGANLLSFTSSFAQHPNSKVYCIDPWLSYDEYTEYKGKLDSVYRTFLGNIAKFSERDKIHIHRGFSHEILPLFANDYFDLIYIDGNHEPDYVLEDAILSFRKVKSGGFMIFDDYNWKNGDTETQRGIDAFLSAFHRRVKVLGIQYTQLFVMKL